ncbi:hypothetical protein XTALMG727_0576 [Xanthomonas translucens pv. arrhenatheri LMG 727]|uniref:Uncharacterized protein n=1 Tax=Xanthomonas graminis pv. arrhenatheri LMG 727 TaxID=1195923 RepID=A0A0K2ZCW9_9XANT|nr:hypothetical protein XTALMG727_0576 [Xanthomonas translucens pv. arrhenatheri LMG 727]
MAWHCQSRLQRELVLIVVCRIVVFKPRPSRDGSGSSRNSVGHRLRRQRPAIEEGAWAVAGRTCRGSRRPQDLHRHARAWREECDDLQHRAHRTGAPGSPRVTSRLTSILWPAPWGSATAHETGRVDARPLPGALCRDRPPKRMPALQQSPGSHRDRLIGGDHEVIQQPDIHQQQDVLQPGCDRSISCGDLGMSAGMVVSHHGGCRVQGQRALDHDAWIHLRPVHRAGEQPLHCDEPVPSVKEGHLEMLPSLVAQPQPEESPARARIAHQHTGLAGPSFEDAQRASDHLVLANTVRFII